MNRYIAVFIMICALAGNALASSTSEGLIASREPDWPQWRGPRRDGISYETGLLPTWPTGGPALLWKADGLGTGWSAPIVVGERVYVTGDVGDDLVIFAFDHEGKIQWRAKNGRAWKGPYPGARACCAYSDGRLYHLNAHGRLACLDASTGEEIWATNILERFEGENITWGLSENLLVDGSRVIVTPGGAKALMAALDKRTGETVWTTEPLEEDNTSYSSPILFRHAGRRLLANCSSAHGFGVDAETGERLWTVPLTNRHEVNAATPIFGDEAIFYMTPDAERGRLYRLRATGRTVNAQHAWTSQIDAVTGSGVLVDATLFAAGYRRDKWWFAIDWRTGETKYELKDLTTGAAIHADERLYVLDQQGTVALLETGPDGFEIVGRFAITTDRIRDAWAHPVLLDGRLYIRYHDTLWCYDVKERS